MMTVSSQLANGVLDIDFDAYKDDAVVAVVLVCALFYPDNSPGCAARRIVDG